MIPVGAQELNDATDRFFSRCRRVVGWGTGSYFDYFQRRFPMRLDFLVDNDRSRIGQSRQGIPIVGVERLLEEDPRDTVVILYSAAWPEIQRQLAAVGTFRSQPASVLFADLSAREQLAVVDELVARPFTRRRPASSNAVVVQGPIIERVTRQVLRVLSARHPADRIVLSTWDDTASALLADLEPFVDDIVTSPQPKLAGIQNRNCQLISARAGLERAVERGAHQILKTRTDLAILGESAFARASSWLRAIGETPARNAGLAGRIIVPANYTRKYLLYHPSDLVMLGHAVDLLRFWSAPLDPRTGDLVTTATVGRPLADVNMDGNPAESYFGLAFCRSLNRAMEGTLRDSWTVYRDLFAVVDNDWFDLLWFKNFALPDTVVRRGVRQLVNQAFWHRLLINDPTIERELTVIDPRHVTLGELAGAA